MTETKAGHSTAARRKTVPERFEPEFIQDLDQRLTVARTLRERAEVLEAETGADSYAKRSLIRRLVYLESVLESHECRSLRGEPGLLSLSAYSSALNSYLGCLKSLGLERKKTAKTLEQIIKEHGEQNHE